MSRLGWRRGDNSPLRIYVIPLIPNIFGNMRIEMGDQIDMLGKHALFSSVGYRAVRKLGAVENKRFRWAQSQYCDCFVSVGGFGGLRAAGTPAARKERRRHGFDLFHSPVRVRPGQD